MHFTVAVIGRPNVGKSTLFNRLVGRKLALVDDRPGVTRDLREGEGRLGALRFTVIDTAGLELAEDDSLPGRMRRLTERAIDKADLCLFLIDARVGITPADQIFAELLRCRGKRAILVANKAEGQLGQAGVLEAYALGLGEPVAISAEHGTGLEDLADAVAAALAESSADGSTESDREKPQTARLDQKVGEAAPAVDVAIAEGSEVDDTLRQASEMPDWAPRPERPLHVAVIGRPNAGKSTLVNAILGEDRLLTGPEAGITRDAIAVSVTWGGVPMRMFDTAGIRKRSRVTDRVERLSVADALRAVRFAEVVVLLLDAKQPLETQDLRLADLVEREGRAGVVAVNKWDLEVDRAAKREAIRARLDQALPQLRGVPLVTLSARTGQGLDSLQKAIVEAHTVWNRRVATSRLNRWLEATLASHPPPAPQGRPIKLRYITQVRTRPPGFVLMGNRLELLPESYQRYLINSLRTAFDLPGTPIRLFLRSQSEKNPFREKSKPRQTALSKHRKA